jgi:hypothetical protein
VGELGVGEAAPVVRAGEGEEGVVTAHGLVRGGTPGCRHGDEPGAGHDGGHGAGARRTLDPGP